MAYNRNQAKTLCNKTEYQFFESSLKGNVEKLPQARVQDGIKRARTLRDKYRDLHKRQRLTTRDRTGTKKGLKPGTNERTEQKAKLFAEVLGRFEARLKVLKQEAKISAASKKKVSKKAPAKKAASKKKVGKKKVGKKAAVEKAVGKKKAAKKTAAKKEVANKKVAKKKAIKKKAIKKKASKKSAAKKPAKKTRSAKAPAAASEFVSEQASAASERKHQQNTRAKAVMGHKRASTQRNQAKRDGGKKR